MNLIDVDALFDAYFEDWLANRGDDENIQEIENKTVELYEKFQLEPNEVLGGKSPIEYFSDFDGKDLVEMLKRYVDGEICVPDALCRAIEEKGDEDCLLDIIKGDRNGELFAYAVNFLSAKKSVKPISEYVSLILDSDVDGEVKGLLTEALADIPEESKEEILKVYGQNAEADSFFLEVLSRCKKDSRISDILRKVFACGEIDLSVICAYISSYNDKDLIDLLYAKIEEDVTYAEFKELKSAIEKLGGSYDKPRDFVSDSVKS